MRAALRLLTALPIGQGSGEGSVPRPGTLLAFPVVGTLIGLVWAAAAATDIVLPNSFLVAAVVLVVDALATGGRPLEALVRVLGGEPASARATVTLPLIVVVRLGALAGLLGFPAFPLLLATAPVIGRWAMVLLLALVPAADDTDAGRTLGRPSGNVVVGASLLAAALAGALDPRSLVVLPLALLVAFGTAAVLRRQPGRELTLDVLLAAGLLAETAALLGLAALLDFLIRG